MKIAITGGTGLIGSALGRLLISEGHTVVSIARGSDGRQRNVAGFVQAEITDEQALAAAFAGCDAVAHCAGVNRERPGGTYMDVHVRGTEAMVRAARAARVGRVVLVSFLRARPNCGSPYHESKWEAEEIVRRSGLPYVILKCGIVYGRGDHLLDHLSHMLHTLPLFAPVGFRGNPVAPAAVEEVARILAAASIEGRLDGQTFAVAGPERLDLSEVVRRVGRAVHRRVLIVPMPVWFHRALASVLERCMKVPLISKAQVRILAEGAADPLPADSKLPPDLRPVRSFTEIQIRGGLPQPGPFHRSDLGCCR
jgi:uncharacterized protein YbjT (DUF2867 family)